MDCLACKSISGEKRISPGRTVFEGKYWLVEHAYPTQLKGWLVIETKRHVESLHELKPIEFAELGKLLEKAVRVLREVFRCEKEYVACFAEVPGFHHIHFHVVQKPKGLPEELKGTKIFAVLKVEEKDAIPRQEISSFCELLAKQFSGS